MTERLSFKKRGRRWLMGTALLAACGGLTTSCDGYDLDERMPDGWDYSIYDYMASQGNYTNMVRIIDALNYREVLSKTGSKTLFAADDEAFDRFYAKNNWGVKSYADLSLSQKKMLLFGAMINNSFQVQALSSTEGPVEGECMRRLSALTVYDTVPTLTVNQMPDNPYWQRHRDRGSLVCMKDMSVVPMIHFIEDQLTNKKITNDDYDFLYNGTTHRQSGDASVNGVQIAEQNIRCTNGFIHRMADVVTPLPNMADLIASKPNTKIFTRLMQRFSAPYYCGDEVTRSYNSQYGTQVDSVFQWRYISDKSQNGREINETPDGGPVLSRLKYDPGWNSYFASTAYAPEISLQRDMGVIMVPSDAALTEYWENGAGRALKERYHTWENVPDNVIVELVNNNMLSSFLASVPSKFQNILNDANDPMGVTKEDIDSVWLGCNGAVYLTNRVYSPTAYVSVSFPALINETMSIVQWGITKLKYNIYLNSLNSYYSFFLPTNNSLLEYIDPVSYGKPQTQLFRFHYDATKLDDNDRVWATIYNYDVETQTVGDSIGRAGYDMVIDRLADILDTHIVIGNVESGNEYYRTKGGTEIRVRNVALGANGMTVEGSYQVNEGEPLHVSFVYDQSFDGNGKTYILEGQPIMGTRKTVRDVLAEHSEFSKFLELMDGSGLFETLHNNRNACGGTNISTFNTYHYTIYAPTNESLEALLQSGKLPTWETVDHLEEAGQLEAKSADSLKIVNFLKYHIQDNAIFIGAGNGDGEYETAIIDPVTERFQKLIVTANNEGISVQDAAGNTRHVLTSDSNLYNLMAREYLYNNGDASRASQLETSSSAVVHLIDGPLMLKN